MPVDHNFRKQNRFDTKAVSLRSVLQKQLRLLDEAVDTLKREMLSTPLSTGAMALSPGDARKMADLTRALTSLVDADIRHEKALLTRKDELTPEQEDAALVQLFLEMPRLRRSALMKAIAEAHVAEIPERPAVGKPITNGAAIRSMIAEAEPEAGDDEGV